MIKVLLVAMGGAAGSVARYLCHKWLTALYPQHFPIGTFIVNITGCLLIGLFWGFSFRSIQNVENWKLLLMTGLCGGFTTFSAFTLEGINLWKENRQGLFFLYIGASVVIGLVATFAGMRLARL